MPKQLRENRAGLAESARRMSPEFWAVIGIGVTILIGLGAGQMSIRTEIRDLREDHREDMAQVREEVAQVREEVAQVRQEVANLYREVIAMGKSLGERLARIEQALSDSPSKITPADAE